ncbi:MAG TPA: ATP-dependent helicase HrpB [Stellaceae bacterium]|nr:ATP-dependent helicase HrpB [Stellaceae bacterium]
MPARIAQSLPIAAALPSLLAALEARPNVVLQAPPGAGKTTVVPLALLDAPFLAGRKVVMLEPRRIAARLAARFMASSLGEAPGATVGYRVRGESRVGPRTRIEIVTDGVFTRLIQDDPELGGIGAVLFDEFHERRIESDLGLALALDAQAGLRPDLRLLVMSATLDAGPAAALMGGAPVVTAEGRAFPVDRRYRPAAPGKLPESVVTTIEEALGDPGDILVFLPGAREIRQVSRALEGRLPPDVDVLPLAGDLDRRAQDRALAPAPPGRRKIVLSTSIAETSVTIDGVRQVVDAGLARFARYDPRTGLTRLVTAPVTQAAAEQRAGRAGRQAPGIVWRLWAQAAQAGLEPYPAPEIMLADLAPLALELAAWGIADPARLRFLTPPPDAALAAARTLLQELGALDAGGRITGHGREMARLGVPPRLAHMIVAASRDGRGALACAVAAVLVEREDAGLGGTDIRTPLEALAAGDRRLQRTAEAARRLARQAGLTFGGFRPADAGAVLALAYPDRVARRRGAAGRYLMSGGQGAALDPADPLAAEEALVVADLEAKPPDGRIRLAAPLVPAEIEAILPDRITEEVAVWYDPARRAVLARRQRRLGALVLAETAITPDTAAVRQALIGAIRASGRPPWNEAAERLRARIAFLRARDGGESTLPDLSDEALLVSLEDWLGPALDGQRSLDTLDRLDMAGLILDRLGWDQRRGLDERAPTHWTVPSGQRHPIDYGGEAPVLRVRLQEMFGTAETPAIDRGRARLVLHLLSPAHRPIQVTDDLGRFWAGSYKAVRADLRGRYPKHPWPEDPLAAEPTTRAKRRD